MSSHPKKHLNTSSNKTEDSKLFKQTIREMAGLGFEAVFMFVNHSTERKEAVVYSVLVWPNGGPWDTAADERNPGLFGLLPMEDECGVPTEEDGVQAGRTTPDVRPADPLLSHRAVEIPP